MVDTKDIIQRMVLAKETPSECLDILPHLNQNPFARRASIKRSVLSLSFVMQCDVPTLGVDNSFSTAFDTIHLADMHYGCFCKTDESQNVPHQHTMV